MPEPLQQASEKVKPNLAGVRMRAIGLGRTATAGVLMRLAMEGRKVAAEETDETATRGGADLPDARVVDQ